MNITKILASTVIALASAMAGSAFAQTSDNQYPIADFRSGTLTRAQVQAELAQAKANGTWSSLDNDSIYPVVVNTGTPKTRVEVRAELAQAKANGTWSNLNNCQDPPGYTRVS